MFNIVTAYRPVGPNISLSYFLSLCFYTLCDTDKWKLFMKNKCNFIDVKNMHQVCSAYILFKSNSESVNVNEHLLCCILTYEHSLPQVFSY